MFTKKLFITLCIVLCLNLLLTPNEAPAKAWIDFPNLAVNTIPAIVNPIQLGEDTANVGLSATDTGANLAGTGGIFTQLGTTLATFIKDNIAGIAFAAAKIAALKLVQVATQAIIGKGGGGGIVTDWNNYLYTAPQQKALAQMNTFFNTASKGRASSLNYEGIGKNYDSYLIKESQQAINGQNFTTTLTEISPDPSKMFDGQNMKGIMTYMQCANNVACYTMTAQNKYTDELNKATTIAKNEQTNGILPTKLNGKISQPASIVANAMSQVDQQGVNLIMQAQPNGDDYGGAMTQIAEGGLLSIAARSLNYALADSKGQAAAQNKNDSFPFSASYSQSSSGTGQLTVGAGGAKTSTSIVTPKITTK